MLCYLVLTNFSIHLYIGVMLSLLVLFNPLFVLHSSSLLLLLFRHTLLFSLPLLSFLVSQLLFTYRIFFLLFTVELGCNIPAMVFVLHYSCVSNMSLDLLLVVLALFLTSLFNYIVSFIFIACLLVVIPVLVLDTPLFKVFLDISLMLPVLLALFELFQSIFNLFDIKFLLLVLILFDDLFLASTVPWRLVKVRV